MSEIQRSAEWHANRCGKITASQMKHVLAIQPGGEPYKSGPKKGQPKPGRVLQARLDYITELVLERLTGEPEGIPTTPPMQWGKDVEPAAVAAYEARMACVVRSVGFIVHPQIPYVGASPDGLVGEGGIEIKCPWNRTVHLETILYGMPEEHMPQVQSGMWVTAAPWWDFISFDPRFPAEFQLYIQRIPRDDIYIARMAIECEAVNREADERLAALLKKRIAA